MLYYTSAGHSLPWCRTPVGTREEEEEGGKKEKRNENAHRVSNHHMISCCYGNWSQQPALGKWVTWVNWRRQEAYCAYMLPVRCGILVSERGRRGKWVFCVSLVMEAEIILRLARTEGLDCSPHLFLLRFLIIGRTMVQSSSSWE